MCESTATGTHYRSPARTNESTNGTVLTPFAEPAPVPERRHRNLVLGTLALLIAVLAAVDSFLLGGTSTDLGRVDVVVWGAVATIALVPYASARARRVRARAFRSRPVRVAFGLFGVGLLALTGGLLLDVSGSWGRESLPSLLSVGFWTFVFGLGGAGALWTALDG